MATTTKKKDDEFKSILLACGLFTVGLVIVDLFFSKFGAMPVWVLLLVIAFHALTAWSWVNIFRHWQDPNKDYWRKVVIVAAIAGILVVLGHRGDWIGKQEFLPKTEQK
jgi:FtsH-binding integral membrane protein